MVRYLRRGELETYPPPSEVGLTTAYTHRDCDAGIPDHKERLYVTRTESGVVAYCHNCNARGFLRTGDPRPIRGSSSAPSHWLHDEIVKEYCVRWSFSCAHPLFTAEEPLVSRAYDYLMPYFSDIPCTFEDLCGRYGLRIPTDESKILAFPVWSGYTDKDYPAYIAVRGKGTPKWTMIGDPGSGGVSIDNRYGNTNTLVVVEDRVSAIKISELGYAAACLHGTNMSTTTLYALALGPWKNVVVWLDNDSDAVRRSARTIGAALSFFSKDKKIRVVSTAGDPKRAYNCGAVVEGHG